MAAVGALWVFLVEQGLLATVVEMLVAVLPNDQHNCIVFNSSLTVQL
jgi:hypothetical protein